MYNVYLDKKIVFENLSKEEADQKAKQIPIKYDFL